MLRRDGSEHRFRPSFLAAAGALTLVILLLMSADSRAGSPHRTLVLAPEGGGSRTHEVQVTADITAERDSLMLEIRRYSRLISDMRDSLSLEEMGLELSPERKEAIQKTIDEVSKVVEDIGRELSELDLEIIDNRISLLNKSGEGIVINIPENLDENISQGLNAITQLILNEMPDSLHVKKPKTWNWSSVIGKPKAPPPARRVIPGNVVKVGDDLLVAEDEDIRGNVVVVFGNAQVAGRVQGDVVVILGDLLVGETAQVSGQIVTVGGRLDQDPDACVGEVVVVDPLRTSPFRFQGFFETGWFSFLASQGLFVLTLVLAMLGAALVPRRRFDTVTRSLASAPGPALGLGLVAAVVGHAVLLVLMGILVLTVIGLPLAVLLGLAVALASVLAVSVAAAVVGERLCAGLGRTCPSPVLAVVAGLAVLHLLSFLGSALGIGPGMKFAAVPLGVLGLAVKTLAYLFGLGALIRSRLGSTG